jgi:hypothetical protein
MDGTGDHLFKQNKPDSERQISCFFSYAECRFKFFYHNEVDAKKSQNWTASFTGCQDAVAHL